MSSRTVGWSAIETIGISIVNPRGFRRRNAFETRTPIPEAAESLVGIELWSEFDGDRHESRVHLDMDMESDLKIVQHVTILRLDGDFLRFNCDVSCQLEAPLRYEGINWTSVLSTAKYGVLSASESLCYSALWLKAPDSEFDSLFVKMRDDVFWSDFLTEFHRMHTVTQMMFL